MRILLANPRGFCAGVNMAIETLELTIKLCGPDIYVYHEIVHNKYVVDRFTKEGVKFVDSIDEVPEGAYLLYSAHGISPQVREAARRRNLKTIDATCPLVTKVHKEATKFASEGYHIILVGHEGHDEVIGTMGECPQNITLVETPDDVDRLEIAPGTKLAYLTQTTLSVAEASRVLSRLRERFPGIIGPPREDICYATTNRQEAVTALATESDVVLVLGSQNSSNSQRLKELGQEEGKRAYLIDSYLEVRPEWLEDCDTVLITAGASAPEIVVQQLVDFLVEKYGATVENRVIREEDVLFNIPKELRNMQAAASANTV